MARPDPSLPQQSTVRTSLRIAGALLLGIGLILTVIGIGSFFGSMASFSGPPQEFWMAFVGLPMIAIGIAMLRAGYLGAATRYVAGEVTPTLRDTLGGLGIGSATQTCASCGAENDADARFCDSCGASLNAS